MNDFWSNLNVFTVGLNDLQKQSFPAIFFLTIFAT